MTEDGSILDNKKILKCSEPFVLGFCACRCQEEIELRTVNGGLRRFVTGHQNRVKTSSPRKKKEGYWQVFRPNHPYCDYRGYILEHRLIMEEHLGRYLEQGEVVHHINEDPLDNRLINLKLMSLTEHISYHRNKNKQERDNRVCYNDPTHKTKFDKKEQCWHWYFLNGDKTKPICSYCRGIEYRNNNREEIKKRKREYYLKNREKIIRKSVEHKRKKR